MATFEKRKNGSWRAKVYAGRDANGKVLYKSVTKPSLKECKAAARALEQQIADNRFVDVGRTRLAAWLDKWLELNEGRLSPTTFITYRLYVETHYKPFFKNLRLAQVNEIHCRDFMNEQLLKKGLSPTTVRKHMLVLSEILRDALKDKNPCEDIKVPEPDEFLPHVVSDDEFQAIRQAMAGTRRGLRDEVIVCLAGWCGLRRGEIFAIGLDDLDYVNNKIRIDEARALSKDGYVTKKPKSKKGLRVVAAPPELMDMLWQYRKSLGPAAGPLLFPGRPDNWSGHYTEVLRRHGLPPVRFHDLRHYHTNWMYENGFPDQYAAKRAGHDIQTLKKIYQHLRLSREESLDEAVRQVPLGSSGSEMGDKKGDKKVK
jgi:integrase